MDPPLAATQIHQRATIAAPVHGTQALVTSFQIPQAMEGIIDFVVNVFDGSGFLQGSGSIVWTIDVDRPLAATLIGYSPTGFASIITQLGDYRTFPMPIPGGIRLYESNTIRYKVTTSAPVGQGAPNFITCMLLGYYWPARLPYGGGGQ